MAGLSDYSENKLLELVTGKTAWTKPTSYVALFTAAPTDAGGGTEVSGGSYARVTTAGSDWAAASGGAITNANDLTFPSATADWGTVVAFALFDASTAGNLLAWGNLTQSKTITSGELAKFTAGDFDITAD